jgi:hypothetical protein
MSVKEKLLSYLKGKKGNALLLSVAAAIAATFGTYFFVAITALSETNKIRVTHLYNAYQMGLAVSAKIDGKDQNLNRVTNGLHTVETLEAQLMAEFHNGEFITLQEMVDADVLAIGTDPTYGSDNIPYDATLSGAEITFADANGAAIGDTTTQVAEILVAVNLAGTPNASITDTTTYATTDPFYYVVMSTTAGGALTGDAVLTATIPSSETISILRGTPQAEGSVLLPVDFQ